LTAYVRRRSIDSVKSSYVAIAAIGPDQLEIRRATLPGNGIPVAKSTSKNALKFVAITIASDS
jgi:hypothetical protein